MYVAKLVLYWIIILCFRQETQAKPTIYMPNRTRVALAGETLYFNLSVDIPANYTTNKLKCYHTQSRMIIWSKELKSEFFETTKSVMAHIRMRNSSSSGNYYFYYTDQQVHLVVHVRDKGYQQPPEELDSAIITMMAFSGILLIFSVAGSLYILKSYKEHPARRDDKNEVAEQRPGGNDEVILDEDPASASLYTALQYRSSSIYDSLHPDTMHEENTLKKKSVKKHCKAQEDEVFDSVYENL
ncbi:NFAT activation molecule 1-like [Sinocyclocheilus rhinocerous]|uniref:NFAT activation molecule 1-like n=1 Tax=Sinocyclocheilus rhinocerous TaxID=307959 RepID=UPI0007B88393|nr:PREDICTED: NFAT activation molecule 1-like [Sinocyclocheilus rhinocerous]